MFTGLIECVCPVASLRPASAGAGILELDAGPLADEMRLGDSIAVSGACLTVAGCTGPVVRFELSKETLATTKLGRLRPGSAVNIERALRANGRLGGHIVQGHVDGVGKIAAIEKKTEFWDICFSASPELLAAMVLKGSVAVDGISLTVAELTQQWFSVAVIPTTLANTTLGNAHIKNEVNIETDIIGKYVMRHLEKMQSRQVGLSIDKLEQAGFM